MGRGIRYDVVSWRQRMGLTQAEAAELIDCTVRSIRRWENGYVKPDPYSVKQMLKLEAHKAKGLPLNDIRPALFKRRRPRPQLPESGRGTLDSGGRRVVEAPSLSATRHFSH